MRKTSLFFASALAMFFSAPATAALYNFSYTAAGLSGSGVITTVDTPVIVANETSFLITDISGIVNGNVILGLTAVGGFLGNNNLLFTTGIGFFDASGVSFTIASPNGPTNSNLYYQSSISSYRNTTTNPFSVTFPTVTVTAAAVTVPEPASIAVMVLGLGLVGGALRQRVRVNQNSA
jgi:PEP-CTERM motif